MPELKTARVCGETRRTQVIQAAICIFARKGFRGTTTKEIADAAGINEALIFRYFHSKEELYSAILDYASTLASTERWMAELAPCAQRREDFALFAGLARRMLDDYPGKPDLFRLTLHSALEGHELARMFREKQMLPLEGFLGDYIRLRQAEGAFDGADARAAASGFLCMCAHHAMLRVLFGRSCDGAGDAEAFTHLFLNGLAARAVPAPVASNENSDE